MCIRDSRMFPADARSFSVFAKNTNRHPRTLSNTTPLRLGRIFFSCILQPFTHLMLPMDAIQAIFKIFPVLGRHDFQHHTGKKRLDPRQQDKATGDQCRESGYQTGIPVSYTHLDVYKRQYLYCVSSCIFSRISFTTWGKVCSER